MQTPFFHFFGPPDNASKGAWTVAKWLMPVSFASGHQLKVPVACVPGDDPILLGADFLDHCIIDNPSNKLTLVSPDGNRHECCTYKMIDGHRYLEVAPREEGEQHYALLQNRWTTLKDKRRLIDILHERTHASAGSLRMLMDRNGLWDNKLHQHVQEVCKKCSICVRTGRPLPSRKVSLSHIPGEFNSTVGVDFFFWNRDEAHTVPCLHVMCMGTSFSEAEPISTREMSRSASAFETLWLHQHGRPVNVGYDPEFNSSIFLAMLRKHGITPNPRPARRRNKLGRVERKHQTIKLILSRIALANPGASDRWIVKFGIFLSNIFFGNQYASAFELARGYTPSLLGTRMLKVPTELLEVHKDLVAQRALQRILRTKAVTPVAAQLLTPGAKIYGYVEVKKGCWIWRPYTVLRCDGMKVEVRSAKRGPKTLLAMEDVRLRPAQELARVVVEQEMGLECQSETPIEAPVSEANEQSLTIDLPLEINDDTADDHHESEENKSGPPTQLSTSKGNQASAVEPSAEEDLVEQPSTPEEVLPDQIPEPEPTLRRSGRQRRPPAKLCLTSTMAGSTLKSIEPDVLSAVYEAHGTEQFTKRKGPDVPDWLYSKALEEELTNWKGQYEPCGITDIPPGSNIVGSHVVYRVKQDDNSALKFKARLVVHGNEDVQKNDVRKDAATAHLTTIRLILSMATLFRFTLAKIDIKAAYFQSGAIRRRIYVRPPREMLLFRTVWKLLGLPYGIAEAGRQWQLVSDDFLHSIGMESIYAVPQCFMLKLKGKLLLLVGKIVDDFLIAGTRKALKWFSAKVNQRFTVGTETWAPDPIRFNGALIEQANDYSIRVTMEDFAKSIKPLQVERNRRKQPEALPTPTEVRDFQSLAGKMNWLGHAAVPQYAFAASYLQQNLGQLKVKHLTQANGVLREAQRNSSILVYGSPKQKSCLSLCAFADAAFPKVDGGIHGQTGIFCGLVLGSGPEAALHPISWSSHKQTRVCRSSSAAEIMAIAEAEEVGSALRIAIERVCDREVPFELNVDSRSLFDTITTQHESKDFRLRQAVRSLRESYEKGNVTTLRWIAGKANPADALTKRNATTASLLNEICCTGRLCVDLASGLASTDAQTFSSSMSQSAS